MQELDSGVLLLVNYKGLNVAKLSALRRDIRRMGGELKVAKKTIARLAFREAEIPLDPTLLEGEIGFVFSREDPLGVAKLIYREFLKEKKPALLGAWFERQVLDKAQTLALALLPSRMELLGQVVRSLAGPLRGFMNVCNETTAGLVRVLAEIKNKKPA